MSTRSPADQALYATAAGGVAAVALGAGVVVIGLYSFALNEAIPPIVDRLQLGMLLLAGLCGLTAVAMLVRFIVVLVKRQRAQPLQGGDQ